MPTSFGGTGDDRFVLSGTLFSGAFDGGTDSDTIDGSAVVWNATLTIDLATGFYRFGSSTFSLTATEHAIGGAGADTITGSDGANRPDRQDSADSIDGSGGSDTLFVGAGDDTLDGGSGLNDLFGGAGDDKLGTVSLATGRDVLDGGTGIDRVRFSLIPVPAVRKLARNRVYRSVEQGHPACRVCGARGGPDGVQECRRYPE